jgi:DNA polymerase III psi subunit
MLHHQLDDQCIMHTIQVFPQGAIADVLEDNQTVIVALEETEEPRQVLMLNVLKSLKLPPDFSS